MTAEDHRSFAAEVVEFIETGYTPDFTVIGFHLGEGDPEHGGEHWNFTQTIPPENDGNFEGVCTVKEIQQVTVYGGIERFSMWPNRLVCEFDEATAPKAGVKKLEISYAIDPEKWRKLSEIAMRVFDGESCFELHHQTKP
ncbi:MAG: hypothetical protein R3F19_07360 [Verrucomicrobiales bacterium]